MLKLSFFKNYILVIIFSVVSDSLWPHGMYSPWNSPGQNTGVGSLSLLQGIFPTQQSNPGLPHHRWIFYQLSHKISLRTLEWVAYPFSSQSSWPRNGTGISWIAVLFFTNWAIREALIQCIDCCNYNHLFLCNLSFFGMDEEVIQTVLRDEKFSICNYYFL